MSQWTLDQFNTALTAAGLDPLTQAQYSANPNISLNADNSPSSPAQYVADLQKYQAQENIANAYPGGSQAYNDALAKQEFAQFQAQGNDTSFGGFLTGLFTNPVVDAIGSLALGPELGAIGGLGSTAGAAEAGSLIGGGTAALQGGNPLTGALEGGATAGLTSGIFDNAGSIGDFLGLTDNAAGQSLGQLTGFNSMLASNPDSTLTGVNAGGATSPGVGTSTGSGGSAIGGPGPGAAASAAPGGAGIFDNGGDVSSQFSSGVSGENPTSLDSSGLNQFTAANSPNFSAAGVDPASVSPSASSSAVNLTGADGTVNPDQGAGINSSGLDSFTAANSPSFGSAAPDASGGAAISASGAPSSIPNTGAAIDSSGGIFSSPGNAVSLNSVGSDPALAGFGNGAAATGSGTGVKAPSSISSFLSDPSLSGFGSMLAANAGPLVAGGGLAASLLQGNKPVKGENQVNQAAAQDTAQGQQLQSYLPSGTLPPGVQQGITQQADAQKAAIRSRYAANGGSGSSAEQQDLAAVDQQAQAQGSAIALELLQAGMNESNSGAALYQNIANTALQQDQSLGSSISAFASSLAGGGGGNIYKLSPAGQ